MARRKNVKRIDPRYFLDETVNRGEELEERAAPARLKAGDTLRIGGRGHELNVRRTGKLRTDDVGWEQLLVPPGDYRVAGLTGTIALLQPQDAQTREEFRAPGKYGESSFQVAVDDILNVALRIPSRDPRDEIGEWGRYQE